jgi:Uncharacterised nucleotidyltransferase
VLRRSSLATLTIPDSAVAPRPEEQLVLCCARLAVGSDPVGTVPELLRRVTDWEYLHWLASEHAMMPLVFHIFNQFDNCSIPPARLEQLQAASRVHAARSLDLTARLLELLSLFDASSIPAVPFKGPVLAWSLYDNVALRDFVDLDILVRREDVVAVRDVLLAHGYRTDLPRNPAQQAAYLRARHELHFRPEDDSCLIELHQAFLPPSYRFEYDYESLWQRLDRTIFYGRDILALAADDLLLVLCAHGAKHRWQSLGWISDVARLLAVSGQTLDWRQLEGRASSMGAARLLWLGVFLAHHVLGAPVPEEILECAGEDARIGRLAKEVAAGLFDGHSARGILSQHRFFLSARERFCDRLRSCIHLALVPTDEDVSLLSSLPSFLSPLSYPFHAARVMAKYGLGSRTGRLAQRCGTNPR